MNDVVIGKGKLASKGVYAARDFKKGELVVAYNLKKLTQVEFDALPQKEKMFTHSFWGEIYLFPEPGRYVNHYDNPSTFPDLERMGDFALRPIKKGEAITINDRIELQNELDTFLETYEKSSIEDLEWLKKSYWNSACSYVCKDQKKLLTLKRIDGNWRIVHEHLSKN